MPATATRPALGPRTVRSTAAASHSVRNRKPAGSRQVSSSSPEVPIRDECLFRGAQAPLQTVRLPHDALVHPVPPSGPLKNAFHQRRPFCGAVRRVSLPASTVGPQVTAYRSLPATARTSAGRFSMAD